MFFGEQQQVQQPRTPTIFDTLVDRNPSGVRSFLAARGLPPSDTNEELKVKLYSLFMADKQNTFREMLNLHPDKDMIIDELTDPKPETRNEKPETGKCGCHKTPARQPLADITLDKLGVNGSILNMTLMALFIFLLIKIIKGT